MNFKPTPTHEFLALLARKGKLLRNYTQNIDCLETRAGVPADKLLQCHGCFATASCVVCRHKVRPRFALRAQRSRRRCPPRIFTRP
jgi:NAD-dependent SIR2 family protein deacetylase